MRERLVAHLSGDAISGEAQLITCENFKGFLSARAPQEFAKACIFAAPFCSAMQFLRTDR
ncbi:hypothetical protein IVA79_00125 [Bradyrhizobium sp. 138]|uniref:hypothetical protein n=1 Tax=Bradyrhizobium sp. 138 TaxID=2782615 RepID=UPI001FFAC894|nr:hypothetical protein [Bradyrhizobium sp. 138]MCK1732388.1 hypothetical protein [Bradyrhizobium sp. 138]